MERRITEEIRGRILQLHAEQRWTARQITEYLRGTDLEVPTESVEIVLKTKGYRDR